MATNVPRHLVGHVVGHLAKRTADISNSHGQEDRRAWMSFSASARTLRDTTGRRGAARTGTGVKLVPAMRCCRRDMFIALMVDCIVISLLTSMTLVSTLVLCVVKSLFVDR